MSLDQNNLNSTSIQLESKSEINLIDIVLLLLRRKKIILGVTIVVVCLGLLNAFSQQRVYQVETILLYPTPESIQPLNVFEKTSVESGNIFATFMGNINSRTLKKHFFDEFRILDAYSQKLGKARNMEETNKLFEGFSKAIKVIENKQLQPIHITFEGTDKEKIGYWLDSYIQLANEETSNQLVRDLQATIDSQIKNLKINISSRRSISKQRRTDDLKRLQEAYQVASELGIHEHLFVPKFNNSNAETLTAELNKQNFSEKLNIINKSVSSSGGLSDYMKGTKVLSAEINALKNRKSDDIHISGLRDLQEQLSRLEAIVIDKDKLQTVTIDKKATESIKPVRPKRKSIVIMSFLLGGLLGVFVAFMVEFFIKLKKKIEHESSLNVV